MSRRRITPRKLNLEKLDPRMMLSHGDLPNIAALTVAAETRSHLRANSHSGDDARPDLDAYAIQLVQNRHLASQLGLGDLAQALTRNAGYARQHGWGATLVTVLSRHPNYTAQHHLTSLLTPPASDPPAGSPSTSTVPAAPALPNDIFTPSPSSALTNDEASPANTITQIAADTETVAVGSSLDITVQPGGLTGAGLAYIITPQPLPANMTFNRGTGELSFSPAPGQAGTYSFSVKVSSGNQTIVQPIDITITQPQLATTEVSGQVVDESGLPLANMPVSIDGATATTDAQGNFTLTGIAANPGPLSAGGAVATAQGRLALTTPVAQLLGHAPYTNANNIITQPLIVPRIDWSPSTSFTLGATANTLDLANAAMPGFNLRATTNSASVGTRTSGTLSLAELPASESVQHMPPGLSSGMLLYDAVGLDLTAPVQLTLPNTQGYQPGAVVSLFTMNMLTGGHDIAGQMVVSDDGRTMTSTAPVTLASATKTARLGASPASSSSSGGGDVNNTSGCLFVSNNPPDGRQDSQCHGCQPTGKSTAVPGNQSPAGDYGSPQESGPPQEVMASDAGLLTGEYFQDHQLVTYQSQGQNQGIDLQYSSGQANPHPVVQYEFTTPRGGNSSSITSITAQVSIGGVIQGAPATYTPPAGFADTTTYNIPLQIDASALATGVYTYTMTVTENFGTLSPSSVTMTSEGSVDVVNESNDALGAGWSVGGLQHLSQITANGPVLITAGQQGTEHFDPMYNSGQTALQDLALSDMTTGNEVLANDGTGTFPDGTEASTVTSFPVTAANPILQSVTGDFDNDGKPDLAALNSINLQIALNDGAGGFSAPTSYTLPSGYVARGLAVGNFTGHTDGVVDLAVILNKGFGVTGYAVAIYTGSGTGTFSSPVVTSVSSGKWGFVNGPDSIAVGDFNGDGKSDLVFSTDDGLALEMLAASAGSMSAATSLTLPTGHLAVGITTVDYNNDGKTDLIIEASNTTLSDGAGTFANLDLYTGTGTGSFTSTSSFLTVGHPDPTITGIVTGDFNGTSTGLEVAVPLYGDADANPSYDYIDMVPLSSSGTWGLGTLHTLNNPLTTGRNGNIVTGDFNGSDKPGIAVTNGTNQIFLLLPDPDSNQMLPVETVTLHPGPPSASGFSFYDSRAGWLTVAPFGGHAATPTFQGPTSDPSTLIHNANGTWTRTYPDGTVIQFNASGQETSQADRNGNTTSFTYVPAGQPGAGSLKTVTDPVGLITTLTYNASGNLSIVTDPTGRVTTFTFDTQDNLTEIVDPDGATTQYGYSTPTNHLLTTETNPNNHTATAHYNSFGQLTSETLFDGTSSTSISSAQTNGLLAPGDSGPLPTAFGGSVTDPDGRTTTLTLNWMSHPTNQADATGATTNIAYSRKGFPTSVTDALGRTTTYTYDNAGNITSITEPPVQTAGSFGPPTIYTETITYNDPYGVPTSITDFNGNTTTFTIDSHGNILRQTNPDGSHEDWTYNAAGQVLTDTNPNGNTTTYAYDTRGRLTTITYPGPGSPHVVYGYDTAGNVTSVTDELGRITTYTYDRANRLVSEQSPVQAAAGKVTAYAYDAAGNLIKVTDALNHATTFSYNARNELIGMTEPANQGTGRQTTYDYDAAGNLISVTDPLGHQTTYAYDKANREVGTTDPDGNRTTLVYDLDGELTSEIDPRGNTASYTYDNLGRVQTVTLPTVVQNGTPSTSVTTYRYDGDNNQISVTDALNHTTTYTYNALNELTQVTDPLNHITHYGYDADGDTTTITDPLGHITTYAYDVRDRLISETEPAGGGTTSYAYDAASELLSLTDPDHNVTTYGYDAAGDNTTVTDPLGHITTYAYDIVGNVTQKTDRDSRITQYGYDPNNRVIAENWVSGGSTIYTMTVVYDAAGRVTKAQDNSSKYVYTYDNAGNLLTVNDQGTTGLPQVTLTYAYDQDGNRTGLTDSQGGVTSYVYDARDELARITQSGTGVNSKRVDFTYDGLGDMTSETRYSDLTGTNKVVTTTYGYDAAERLTGITDKMSVGTIVASYAYTLDAANRLTQETQTWQGTGATSDTTNYTYTNNNQLTGVTHTDTAFANETFSFDSNGNRNMSGYATGTDNQTTSDGTYNYTYDNEGNLITKTDIATGAQTQYSYDFRNRLTEVDQVVGGVKTVLATYTYDALDRRIGVSEGGATTWTLYDGTSTNPLMEFNGSGTLTVRYLDGPSVAGVDAVLSRDTSSGGVAWYLTDRLGSVNDLVNNSGTVIDHIAYSAFGQVLSESNAMVGDRFKYAGMQADAVTGLDFDQARWYDPSSGRFVSQDPMKFDSGDVNLYRYVKNDPYDKIDPTGMKAADSDDDETKGHRKNKRPSNEEKHQKGVERKKRDRGGEKKDDHPGWRRHRKVICDTIGSGVQWVWGGVTATGQYLYEHPIEAGGTGLAVGVGVIVWLDPIPGDEVVYTCIVGGGVAIAH